jgi:hypothetical protein
VFFVENDHHKDYHEEKDKTFFGSAGRSNFERNAKGFTSGIYLYLLKVEGKTIASRKYLLLK